jgi:hypothetical protein
MMTTFRRSSCNEQRQTDGTEQLPSDTLLWTRLLRDFERRHPAHTTALKIHATFDSCILSP